MARSRIPSAVALWSLAVFLAPAGIVPVRAADTSAPPPAPPPFLQLRYDENYAYLRDPANRAELLDPIKFIPLDSRGDSYLTLGGEVRERYEYYHNSQWGLGPQDDNGYLLQRYMIHADTTWESTSACSRNSKVASRTAATVDPGQLMRMSSIFTRHSSTSVFLFPKQTR